MTMTRQELEAQLVDYLFDDMDAAVRVRFEAALEAHPDLQAEVAAHARTREVAATISEPELPPHVVANVMREARLALERPERSGVWTRWFEGFLRPTLALALVALALGVTSWLALEEGGVADVEEVALAPHQPPRAVEVAPAPVAEAFEAAEAPEAEPSDPAEAPASDSPVGATEASSPVPVAAASAPPPAPAGTPSTERTRAPSKSRGEPPLRSAKGATAPRAKGAAAGSGRAQVRAKRKSRATTEGSAYAKVKPELKSVARQGLGKGATLGAKGIPAPTPIEAAQSARREGPPAERPYLVSAEDAEREAVAPRASPIEEAAPAPEAESRRPMTKLLKSFDRALAARDWAAAEKTLKALAALPGTESEVKRRRAALKAAKAKKKVAPPRP